MTTYCWNCSASTADPYQSCDRCGLSLADLLTQPPRPNQSSTAVWSPGIPDTGSITSQGATPTFGAATLMPANDWSLEIQRRREAFVNLVDPTPSPILRALAGASIGGLIVGSLGPWVSFGLGSVSGTSGDGKLTLVIGIVAGLLLIPLFSGTFRRGLAIVAGLILGGAAIIGIYDWSHISALTGDEMTTFFNIGIGWGLQMTVLSAILGVIVCIAAIRSAGSEG